MHTFHALEKEQIIRLSCHCICNTNLRFVRFPITFPSSNDKCNI